MRDLDYQARVLTVFDAYLTELSSQKQNADEIGILASTAHCEFSG